MLAPKEICWTNKPQAQFWETKSCLRPPLWESPIAETIYIQEQ